VPSVEPSSTTMIWWAGRSWARTDRTLGAMNRSELNGGMTTEIPESLDRFMPAGKLTDYILMQGSRIESVGASGPVFSEPDIVHATDANGAMTQAGPLGGGRGLGDQTIFCLSDSPWNSPISGRQRIALRLARQNPVVYVEPAGALDDIWRRPAKAVWRETITAAAPGLHVLRLPDWAGRAYRPTLRDVMAQLRARLLRPHLRRAPSMVLAFHPSVWPTIQHLGDVFLAYHVYDDYPALETEPASQQGMRVYDQQLTQRSNVIVAVSESLAEARSVPGKTAHVVHNGVDYDLFAADHPTPTDLASIPRPRVGDVARLNPLTSSFFVSSR
jgi:hypothetical protein